MGRFLFFCLAAAAMSSGCGTINRSVSASASYPLIVTFGDSFTAGLGVGPDENYPAKLQSKIDAGGYRYEVINAGVSGETSQQGLNRIDSICALRPRFVIVEFGANDALKGLSVETTHRNLSSIVSRLRSIGATVLVAGMEAVSDQNPQRTEPFYDGLGIARKHHAFVIPFFLQGVEGNPRYNQRDGLHPNARGYDRVVENVWRVLEPLISSSQ